jgi:CubicO group peptidase (beta-lactamase class C family)
MSETIQSRSGCRPAFRVGCFGCLPGLLAGLVLGAVGGVWGWLEMERQGALHPLADLKIEQRPLTLDETRTFIDGFANDYLANDENVGLVVGIVRDGVPHVFGYGRVAMDRDQAPDGDTVFEIASVGKTFTATVLADMHLSGELSWDAPLEEFLPEEVGVPRQGDRRITLLDLATQTSGLPSLPPNFVGTDPLNPYKDFTVEQMYAGLEQIALSRAPGTQYEYSNFGFGLLGHALERKAGASFEELVIARLCGPLAMDSTRMTLDESLRSRLVTPHDGGRAVPVWEDTTMPGAGSFLSTANDMLRYISAHWRTGDDGGTLTRALHETTRKRRPGDAPSRSLGLAWHIDSEYAVDVIWHNGGSGGSRSYAGFLHEPQVGVVVLSNSSNGVDELGSKVLWLLAQH